MARVPHPVRRARAALHRTAVAVHARTVTQEGQATAEYGLVVVAAAGIAAALIAFGKGGFQAFFAKVIDRVIDQVR